MAVARELLHRNNATELTEEEKQFKIGEDAGE
jgi:hypothetical protein